MFSVFISAFILSPAKANDEGVIYSIGEFNSAAHQYACGNSKSGDFTWYVSTTSNYQHYWNTWDFDRATSYTDSQVYFDRLADQGQDGIGQDHSFVGADSHDIAVVYSHGNATCSHFPLPTYWSTTVMGNSGQSCDFRYGNPSTAWGFNDAFWGNTDVEWMILDACHSLDRCVHFQYAGYPGGYLGINSPNLSGILGYTNCSTDSFVHALSTDVFVSTSRYNGMGDNWVDDMTILWPNDPDASNECASAIIYGDNQNDRNYIYNWAGFQDRKTPTSSSKNHLYFNENC